MQIPRYGKGQIDHQIALEDNITPLHIAVEGSHVESVKPFLALPEAEKLANLSTTKMHLKPLHFAVEVQNRDIAAMLVDLTEGFKGQPVDDVIAFIQKQFDAEKPKPKPTQKISASQRKVCEHKFQEGKVAVSKKQFEKAVHFFTDAIAIDPYNERFVLFTGRM